MWKAITLVASAAVFSLIGLHVEAGMTPADRLLGATVGCIVGFGLAYVSIIVAVSSDKPK